MADSDQAAVQDTRASAIPEVRRVLVVEDDELDGTLITGLLHRAAPDLEVASVASVGETRLHIEAGPPDCVLLDLGLPDATGLEALDVVRLTSPATPVVVVSGHDEDQVALRAVASGADDFVSKGHLEAAALWRTVRFAVARRRGAGSEVRTDPVVAAELPGAAARTTRGPDAVGAGGVAEAVDAVLADSQSGLDSVAVISLHVLGSDRRGLSTDEVVAALGAVVRSGDRLVARDTAHHVVIVAAARTADELFGIADRLAEAVATLDVGGERVEAVQGIAVATGPDEDDAAALVGRADRALGRALERGLPYELYDPDSVRIVTERTRVRREMLDAIGDGSLVAEYLPFVDLATGRVEGFEALIRWRHPDRGLVAPASIFPLARRSVVMNELTRHIVVSACVAARSWNESRTDQVFVSVNVGVDELRAQCVVEAVRRALEETGHPPGLLWVEVPGDLVYDEFIGSRIGEIARLGVRLAVDGFGVSLATSARLAELPFEIAKIDRRLGSELDSSAAGRAVFISTVTALAAAGLEPVAGGIENDDQRRRARESGCRLGQGFGLGRPLTADQALDVLARQAASARAGSSAAGRRKRRWMS